MIPPQRRGKDRGDYFKDRFVYDAGSDSYQCPQGQTLRFRGLNKTRGRTLVRVYAALKQVCHACPAYGVCTRDKRAGRVLWISANDVRLRQHRTWMETEEARRLYAQRKGLIEPVFGIIKEQLAGRRFLLRGLDNVRAEFALLAMAFNLKMLWKQGTTRRNPALGECYT